MSAVRTFRAGSAIEDYCRVCKLDRMHTVVAADANGQAIRVRCGYCGSEHNYRGGARMDVDSGRGDEPSAKVSTPRGPAASRSEREPFALVTDRERVEAAIMLPEAPTVDLELLLRRIIRE